MQRDTKSRAAIAALIYTMTNAVIFGAGLIMVLILPALRGEGMIWIPLVVMTSLILAAPAARAIAPRLRARYWRQRPADRSPAIMLPRM